MTFLAELALLMIMAEPAQTRTPALYVATYVDVQLTSINQGIGLIKQYRETTRAETGNSGVDAGQEIGRPNRFVIIEFWKDQSAFDAHEKAETTAQCRARLKAIQNSPYDQRVHQALAADSRLGAATNYNTPVRHGISPAVTGLLVGRRDSRVECVCLFITYVEA